MENSVNKIIGACAVVLLLCALGCLGWFCLGTQSEAQAQTAYQQHWLDAGLPQPADAEIVEADTTIANLQHGMKAHLSVPKPLNEAVSYYESALAELGWETRREMVRDQHNYCSEFQQGNRCIQIHATSGQAGTSVVRIFYREISATEAATIDQVGYRRQYRNGRVRRLSLE